MCIALAWAAKCGNEDVIRVLLANGARVDTVNADNESPLQLAARAGLSSVIPMLMLPTDSSLSFVKQAGMSVWQSCTKCIHHNHARLLLCLLSDIVESADMDTIKLCGDIEQKDIWRDALDWLVDSMAKEGRSQPDGVKWMRRYKEMLIYVYEVLSP